MALRWTAVAFDAISRGSRRIMVYKHFWMLKAALEGPSKDRSLVEQAKAGQPRIQAGVATATFHYGWDIIPRVNVAAYLSDRAAYSLQIRVA